MQTRRSVSAVTIGCDRNHKKSTSVLWQLVPAKNSARRAGFCGKHAKHTEPIFQLPPAPVLIDLFSARKRTKIRASARTLAFCSAHIGVQLSGDGGFFRPSAVRIGAEAHRTGEVGITGQTLGVGQPWMGEYLCPAQGPPQAALLDVRQARALSKMRVISCSEV